MAHHNQAQQQGEQDDEPRAQETVQREGLDQLDGGQGWRPPAEGGTESTIESAQGGDQPQQGNQQGSGVYDSGQGSRPSAEGGEEEEGLHDKEPWNG